ncbi:AhpC/TSA family protein [Pseudovibrio sp. Ad37]|nr:AhpC/TSA family protein [Pseudovibrio sp. Ad37]
MLLNTPVCDFGWKAPDFTLKDPDGNSFTMSECIGEKGLLIAFICNHCPYVQAIGDRLAADTSLLISEGFGILAVMSNDYHSVPADAPRKMKDFSQLYGFEFPYRPYGHIAAYLARPLSTKDSYLGSDGNTTLLGPSHLTPNSIAQQFCDLQGRRNT